MTFVTWQKSFDGISFLASEPFHLGQCWFADKVAALEVITISILRISSGFDFGNTLYILRNVDVDMRHFQIFQIQQASIEVDHIQSMFEVDGRCAWEGHQDVVWLRRADMLLLG
jgi:hypothetical protein